MAVVVKRVLACAAALAILLILLTSIAWWSLHTPWFAALVRERIVSTLQAATGGRVEMRGFRFNPDTLEITLSGLVVHGTEATGSEPLISVLSADIIPKILSVWRQEFDLQSVVFTQPEVHLILNPDGTTNIPKPKRQRLNDPVEQLLHLKIRRLEVLRGLVAINNRTIPVAFVSTGTGLLLSYDGDGPSYGVYASSEALTVSNSRTPFEQMRVSAKGRLYQDRMDIESLNVLTRGDSSSIALSGKIEHFSSAKIDAAVNASLSIDELAKLGGIHEQLRDGRGVATGSAHYDLASGQFVFRGTAGAKGVDFLSDVFKLRNIDGTADVIANNQGVLMRRVEASARGAHFSGEVSVAEYRRLIVEGRVSHVALREVGKYLTDKPFPWSGSGHGTAYASANLGERESDFIIGAEVEIEKGDNGIPTAGHVDIAYYDRSGKIEFGNSNLELPHSTASFNGALDADFRLTATTTDLADLQPLVQVLGVRLTSSDMPILFSGGAARFSGTLYDLVRQPAIHGELSLNRFKFQSNEWESLSCTLSASKSDLVVTQFELHQFGGSLTGSAFAQMGRWTFGKDTPLHLSAHFSKLDVIKTAALFETAAPPMIQGVASGNMTLSGTWNDPHGSGDFQVSNLDAYQQQINQIQLEAALDGNRLQLSRGRLRSGPALLSFSGTYRHSLSDWSTGDLTVKADTNGFPLTSLSTVRKFIPLLDARAELHLEASGKLRSTSFEPLKINGTAEFQHVSIDKREFGNASLTASTQGHGIEFEYSGDLRETKFHGSAQAQLSIGTPIRGGLEMDRLSLANIKSLASESRFVLPVNGYLDGNLAFDGLLEEPAHMHVQATVKDLQIASVPSTIALSNTNIPDLVLRNSAPILVDIAGGVLNFSSFQMEGRETSVNIAGSAPLLTGKPVAVKAVGKANLGLFMLFDPNVRSSGSTELSVSIGGPITSPSVNGTLQVRNGQVFLGDIPNGLSDVNGLVVFTRNRATIQKMTAHSGGGDISLGGSITFGESSSMVYHLEAAARNVRVRYANSISVTGNSDLRLGGTSASSLLSGTLTVTRVVFTPNADAGNLLAAASAAGSSTTEQGDFISGIHLDVGIESAPNLQVSTNLSRDVEAEIQLRLRGTPDHPVVLGNIAANQGDLKIFGTRFSLNRGDVSFVNTVRIEPVLDLDLETQARGVTVDITVSGTPSKLNFNYRSDPPLQPRDIIALLTVGRAPGLGAASNAQGGSDVTALSSGVNTVLGQAISPVSNRLSKLFGITNIKIDPFVQGITNTPQARLSVEQQISRDVTVTYVTNLSQTSEQIFRFEWALNRQFSVVAIRDDNGEFGVDFQYKKRFK